MPGPKPGALPLGYAPPSDTLNYHTLTLFFKDYSDDKAKSSKMATMFVIFIIGLIAGPAVSL